MREITWKIYIDYFTERSTRKTCWKSTISEYLYMYRNIADALNWLCKIRNSVFLESEFGPSKPDWKIKFQWNRFIGSKDSIHSKDKLNKKYPDVNVTAIQTLYGLNVSPMAQDCNIPWISSIQGVLVYHYVIRSIQYEFRSVPWYWSCADSNKTIYLIGVIVTESELIRSFYEVF